MIIEAEEIISTKEINGKRISVFNIAKYKYNPFQG